MIPDSHAHLDLIEAPVEEVLREAAAAGVGPIITIGINLESSALAVEATRHPGVFASVGIHPNDTADAVTGSFERLEELARSSGRVVAIGETGLDYYRDRSPAGRQAQALREHARLAARLGKPLIVHDRQAHADVLEILAEEARGVRVVMHCFSGDEPVLRECLSRGYYISFAGPLTFKSNKETRRLATLAPADRLLVETDAPFLSPEPYRGKPNSPARVRVVAEELARVRSLSLEEMEETLAANTERVFGIKATEG